MFYSSYVTPFHSHNTMQLVFDLCGRFRLRTRNAGWGTYKCLVIKEHVVHQLDTAGSAQLIVYLDPASELAVAIKDKYLRDKDPDKDKQLEFFAPEGDILQRIRPGELERCLIGPDKQRLEKVVYQLLHQLREGLLSSEGDHRISRAMNLVAGEYSGEMTIGRLAGNVFLSESRLRSVFKQTAGISLHQYIILRRVTLAMIALMNGATIAEAAAGGGFSDSSHFHRVMLRQFGVTPSGFMKDNSKKMIERSAGSNFLLVTRQD